jgi:hypothetical protein
MVSYIRYTRRITCSTRSRHTIYEDNAAALNMANASQPTKRTRHMDIRHFAIQEWVERDLIQLKRVDTTVNLSDTLTAAQRILFYRHLTLMAAIAHPVGRPRYLRHCFSLFRSNLRPFGLQHPNVGVVSVSLPVTPSHSVIVGKKAT